MFEAKGLESWISIDYLLGLLSLTLEVSLGSLILWLSLLLAQVVERLLDALLESRATMLRHQSDGIRDFCSLLLLLVEELTKFLDLNTILFHVNDSITVLHILAVLAMALQNLSKDVVDAEKFYFKHIFDLLSLSLHDVSSPHSDDFPLAEVPKEVLWANLAIVLSIVVPLLERDELYGFVIDVSREALLRHGEKLLSLQVLGSGRVILGILD